MSEPDTLSASVRIAAPPESVFPYLTDPALLVRWLGDGAELEPVPGGRFAVDINGTPIRGRFVLVDPPHRVIFSWGTAGSDTLSAGSTMVEITRTADATRRSSNWSIAACQLRSCQSIAPAGGASSPAWNRRPSPRRSGAQRSVGSCGKRRAREPEDGMCLVGKDARGHSRVVIHDCADVIRRCGEDSHAGPVAVVCGRHHDGEYAVFA